ncbi:pyruvate kinase [Occallatibacter riparius]|uniref:Pyruvate kinase n=1 Tax=Occallatibacter riparius TaxID=1002689 RepID=A0A9J7BVM2_9BACT|nr:pyruvate kinase [Occallatibacter riparius]UWZ84942.1 pyruvate kinase [Occallatibacter riparius]
MPFAELSLSDSITQRRAKIVATLGPASNTEPVFRDLVRAGVDVVRLNFSHGTHEEKLALIQMIRKVSREERKPLCILGDLQGPKIRTSKLRDHQPVLLQAGKRITITPREVPGTATLVGTTFKTLAENVEQGSRILLSDGLIELRVHEVLGDDVVCEIVNGGMLGENKGINLPGIPVRVPSLTEKDDADLEFALKNGVDAIAVSFVRTAEDIRLVRNRVSAYGSETWIIAKLEKPQAIEQLDQILQASDGIMVARGDLGVEVPPEKVPAIQKHIIRRAGEFRKPVITATQMLESMIENPRPTRAEASDVANAVYDGTDAVMLSGESAVGKYPIQAVAMMARIVHEAERTMKHQTGYGGIPNHTHLSIAETICEATAHAAEDLDLRGIALFTETGATARQLSKYHPSTPIFGLSPNEITINRLNLLWGTVPIRCPKATATEAMVDLAETLLEQHGFVRPREVIAIVAGTRTKSGSTNFLRLHVLGERGPDSKFLSPHEHETPIEPAKMKRPAKPKTAGRKQ